MKKIVSLALVLALLSPICAFMLSVDTGAVSFSFATTSPFDLSKAGVKPGDDSAHGNHQTRTVHTSHGDYAAYITGTYTDSAGQTVNKWSLIKIDPASRAATVVFTGEKYYDSSQVSLLVDKDENVWAITSTSDSRRNITTREAFDCRAHKLDAKTGTVTSYTSIINGGAADGYGYSQSFYDEYNDRILVMHAGGDYVKGRPDGASLNWTIFSLKDNSWQSRVRYIKIPARHCYFYGYFDENGGFMLLGQRDIKAVSIGYPEIGDDTGISTSDRQYMQENGITRWAANYSWDQLDLYYFPNVTLSKAYTHNVVEADFSKVTGTQTERFTFEKRLTNYYPANQNNNGGDMLYTSDIDGRKILHITYNIAYIQAAMDRSKCSESTWRHQVWDVTDPMNAQKIYDLPIVIDGSIADMNLYGGGFNFRLYRDSNNQMYLISGNRGAVSVFAIIKGADETYTYKRIGAAKTLSNMTGDLISISSHRGGSKTDDDTLNILYRTSGGSYCFTQCKIDFFDYQKGDANADKIVSAVDSYYIRAYLAGKGVSIESDFADVDSDGTVSAKDSLLLKKKLVGY